MDRRAESSPGEQPGSGPGAVEPVSRGEMELDYETEAGPVEVPETAREQERDPEGVTSPRPVTDPSLDRPTRTGLSGGTWIALILGAVVLVLLLIFILQNNVPAQFAYFGWEFGLPLGVAMLFAAIAGVLITALLGSVRLFKLSRRVRRLEKERETIKRAIR